MPVLSTQWKDPRKRAYFTRSPGYVSAGLKFRGRPDWAGFQWSSTQRLGGFWIGWLTVTKRAY